MSNKMITAAWEVPLPAYARLVLIALADSASEDEGVCWISNRTIMNKACAGKSTVGYILAAFERLGIAVRETRFEARKNGAQTSSIKRINVPIFVGTDDEIRVAKARFAAEYDEAYAWARSPKDTPSHDVVGEGAHHVVPTHPTQSGIPHSTLCGTPPTTLGGTLEPSSYPSLEPSLYNTPLTPKGGQKGGKKVRKKTMTIKEIADLHGFTVAVIEDFIGFRLNSGGIDTPDAFEKYLLRELSSHVSSESIKLEEWFDVLQTQKNVIDHLVNQFLSTQRFDRRFCRELAKDDLILKIHNIAPSDVVIEIAYQKSDVKRRERIIGGVA